MVIGLKQVAQISIPSFANDIVSVEDVIIFISIFQKQPPRGVLSKSCSENMQQICTRIPMLKYDFNKAALQIY